MGFATALKGLRTKSGLTQRQLANASGISLGGLRNLEQGIREPSWQTVQKLARALGTDCRAFELPPAAEPTKKRSKK
jgi:transcriptional regulator with XRE-family HTH domain